MLYNPPVGATDPNAAYVQGNAALGVQGSKPPAIGFEAVQREIVAVIANAGLTPTNADLGQLLEAIQLGKPHIATMGGAANALTYTLTPTPAALIDGFTFRGKIAATNTAAATLGGAAITDASGNALRGGEMVAGQWRSFTWSAGASAWQVGAVLGVPSQSLGANGYRKFDGGLILQWGNGALPASGNTTSTLTVVFPLAFPAGLCCVIGAAQGAANSTYGYLPSWGATGLTLSGFYALADTLTASGSLHVPFNQTVAFSWMAFGY